MTTTTLQQRLSACNLHLHSISRAWDTLVRWLDWLQAPALLAARLYVAYVFFNSGLQSLRDWAGTVWLYENEFHVALLPPHIAAVAGTAGEILLPPLLALGLFGRFGALGLFVVNAVALLSYLYALQPPAIMFHFIWGILIAVVALWGPGKWSVDHLRSS
ncbi:MAG: DoxX family protein [Thiomonas sp.]|uniref:DoxX family protein n=1 Tax=Thiomonas sp. TaxID=2047785 RepID=UPI002A3657B5|nr:DoxX family protein [Thiomonas sp.]MDY0329571.1 DoxX family protein [Thiomonas sp.]